MNFAYWWSSIKQGLLFRPISVYTVYSTFWKYRNFNSTFWKYRNFYESWWRDKGSFRDKYREHENLQVNLGKPSLEKNLLLFGKKVKWLWPPLFFCCSNPSIVCILVIHPPIFLENIQTSKEKKFHKKFGFAWDPSPSASKIFKHKQQQKVSQKVWIQTLNFFQIGEDFFRWWLPLRQRWY